ncbi:MAG: hypothetical protein CM1200mP26_01780 [Acidimicrobiales bacterium]|nr:MAG: hypothetical protein CM1200mP26_01780 [Acidimicrobiales bacterium]
MPIDCPTWGGGIPRLLADVDRVHEAEPSWGSPAWRGRGQRGRGPHRGPSGAVPTRWDTALRLRGVSALLGMLASCASGLTVVGIDNGLVRARAVCACWGGLDRSGACRATETGASA